MIHLTFLTDFNFNRFAIIANQIIIIKEILPVPAPTFSVEMPEFKNLIDGVMCIWMWRPRPNHIWMNEWLIETNPHSLYSIPQSHNLLMPESVVLCLECLNQPDLSSRRQVEINEPIILLYPIHTSIVYTAWVTSTYTLTFPIVLFTMKMLFPNSSSSSNYREIGGITRRMLIAWESFTSLLDE